MSYNPSNIFAKIIRGENEHCLAILDAFPMVKGHTLLLPKFPCVNLFDMPADIAAKVCMELPKICAAVKAATNADAVTVVANNGKESGQIVFHSHFHIIPRFHGDHLLHYTRNQPPLSEEQPAVVEALVKALKGHLV